MMHAARPHVDLQRWRMRLILALLFGGFAALSARAVYLQTFHADYLTREGDKRVQKTIPVPANRGVIRDRRGEPVAVSTPVETIYLNPREASLDKRPEKEVVGRPAKEPEYRAPKDEALRVLAEVLGRDERELRAEFAGDPHPRKKEVRLLTQARARALQALQIQALSILLQQNPKELARQFGQDRAHLPLAKQLDPLLAKRVMSLRITGISSEPEFRRYYPAGEVMAHVLGMTNFEDRGQEGVEAAFQSWLAGEVGRQKVIRDAVGNAVEYLELEKPAKPGRDLTLSINQHIQYLAYRELSDALERHQARAGSVVVLDAKSGEILALANAPSYNPNSRASYDPDRVRNRAVTDVFEPGSTMKPMLVAAALDAGVVTPETTIDTGPGWFIIGDKRIHDTHPKGVMTVAESIQLSSNVATAKIALEMRGEDYWTLLNKAGLGAKPNSGLPAEAKGALRPFDKWRPIEKATMAYGHGLSVSLLQLARAYTAFANKGVMPGLTILRREEPAKGPQVMKPETAEKVLAMLELVTQNGGTAPMARVAGYRVAGKTGTAHKFRVNGGGYEPDKYISSFVGLAPASNPRLVVAVMIDDPGGRDYYGGLVAAPVFSRVMAGALRFMALPPDTSYSRESAPPGEAPVIPESV